MADEDCDESKISEDEEVDIK